MRRLDSTAYAILAVTLLATSTASIAQIQRPLAQTWAWMIGGWNCTGHNTWEAPGVHHDGVMVWRNEGRPVGTLANAPITFVSGDAQSFTFRTAAGAVFAMIRQDANVIHGVGAAHVSSNSTGPVPQTLLACTRITMQRAQ